MASKSDLMKQAATAGLIPADAPEEDFTVAQLEDMLSPDRPAWKGSLSSKDPIKAPDGHENLSKEDVKNRG
jgi:hypothetical protein